MNLRYLVGSAINLARQKTLSSPYFPLTRYVSPGVHWMYDIQRIVGSRHVDEIFDVGANVGQTAWGLVRYFRSARIHCFEPVSSTYQVLKARFGSYRNVTCVRAALGEQSESRTISLYDNSEQNTLVESGAAWATGSGRKEVIRVTTLDEFCSEKAIRKIDILKLDVQGWEMHVLRNQSVPARFIYCEVGFRKDEPDMQYFNLLNDYMLDAGYEFGGLYEQFRYGAHKQFVGFANALYIRKIWP